MSVKEALERFDAVIICESFVEGSQNSPSGRARYSSWLDEADYGFLRGFAAAGKLIVDRRCGANAFAWWGGRVGVRNELLNPGEDLDGDGRGDPTDLTDVFGVYSYGGMDLAPAKDGSKGPGIDLRIVDTVRDITDHYNVEPGREGFPAYNPWENGGTYLVYIPRSGGVTDTAWTRERLEALPPAEKPCELPPYEAAYGGSIREFARDLTTGNRTGYAFTRKEGRPPVIVWAGAQEPDIGRLVDSWAGTRIAFEGLEARAGQKLYLYYNAATDMLQLRERDLGKSLPCPYGAGPAEEREFVTNRPR
jgi:hypothetical protein